MERTMVSRRVVRRHIAPAPGERRTWNTPAALLVALLVLLAATAWSWWPTLADLSEEWHDNEDYSAGQLVPLVAILLVWVRRKSLQECALKPCWWGGVTVLVLAQAVRIFGLLFMFDSAQRYSLVFTIAGLVLMVAGWQVFRRVFWVLLFLFLMVPWPGRVHNMISGPLQQLATSGSVFFLEAFLPRVSQQGNIVMLSDNTPMAVAEACSGLRMLTAFIIVSGFVAYMVKRARWQKTVLLLSSVPVAVVCNIIRIVTTALLMLTVSTEVGEKFFHDFAGLVMMPAAVLLLFGEIWLMDHLVVPEPATRPSPASIVTRRQNAG
jgi:exosortase